MKKLYPIILLILPLLMVFTAGEAAPQAFTPVNTDMGYGMNVAVWDTGRLQAMGFDWMKVFNAPGSQQPLNVLLRIDVKHTDSTSGVRGTVGDIAQNNGAFIDAYEIGNEVNLDASYGWGASPDAAAYTALLCAAYDEIKTHDPTALVISAGLAPVGRVTGNWNGHPGHNGLYQDDYEYLKEMIAAGAGACLDAVGYHNYGYASAYDADPKGPNCTNGFCFRGVENIYEIMQANGLGGKPVWTTEFGWITDPAEEGLGCTSDPSWQGRLWQIVSQQRQADNLAGAYTYAAENWPWMGAIIAFNLNFNEASYYQACEQMRFYSVAGRPAEAALRDMPKAYNFKPPEPQVETSGQWALMALPGDLPQTMNSSLQVENIGPAVMTYTVSIDAGQALIPTVTAGNLTGSLGEGESAALDMTLNSGTLSTGTYEGLVTVGVDPAVNGYPLELPLRLFVVDEINFVYLPLVSRP